MGEERTPTQILTGIMRLLIDFNLKDNERVCLNNELFSLVQRYDAQILDEKAQSKDLYRALSGILEIGKRDTTNPKYDGYFNTAKEACAKYTV